MSHFCHLHCHTQYSLLDGAARISRLIEKAQALDFSALAITDHGNLYGVPEFYTKAKKQGLQPIIGCEFYIAHEGMYDRQDRRRYHQVLLATSEVGYRNLMTLSSLSYTDGYYYKPRIDKELLKKHSEGLIATTCCLQGEVLQTILQQGEAEGQAVFEQYLDIFGENYYIELQDHGIAEQKKCNAILLKWAKAYNVKTVATNDVHYVEQADAEAQDIMLCLQTGKDFNDPNRMRFEGDQFFLKSTDEMRTSFPDLTEKVVEEALDNTGEIADRCDFELPMGQLLMPHYPLPDAFGTDMNAYLRHLVFEGAKERYAPVSQTVVERLEYELHVIREMGYAGYFLIVQDFTTVARDLGVSVGPGRGSAAGSAVAYCLGITNIDPLPYNLLFERFLNPERVSMPDIDIDFDDRGRGKVIEYVVEKYGRENVCQIVTFGTMGARSVLRDVARVLKIPLAEADRIAKLVPEGPKVSLANATKEVPEFAALAKDTNPQIRKLLQYAHVLEGSARHTGVHAAGVIIAPGKVSDYVPVAVAKGKSGQADVMTTQFDGKYIEEFGLLKMDFLGLKTLTILKDACALIETNHGLTIDLDTIPLDDEKTFQLFQRGETVAVFQFESGGMREWMRKLRPTSMDDLIAMNALYRPGPMDLIPNYIARKHGKEKVTFPHALLEEILAPTFGLPIYQEQVMQMAQTMGGYTLGGADLLRRAMGKKNQAEMDKQRTIFVEGAKKNAVEDKQANEIFDMMAKFAGYGFNKSHSAAYSLVAYQTAYLKAHYPAEFMAAVMTNEMGDTKKLAVALEEARRMGVDLLPPSINRSMAHFAVEEGKVRFGLGAIKGVGLGAIEIILEARASEGTFRSLYQLLVSLDLRQVNKKTIECLAGAGALDDLEGHRAQFVAGLEDMARSVQQAQLDRERGQNSLFGGDGAADEGFGTEIEPNLPFVEEWNRADLLKAERELVGFYISGHPLDEFAPEIRAFSSAQFGTATTCVDGQEYSFCGMITEVRQRTTKQGRLMAYVSLEDYTGQGEMVVFSNQYERFQVYLQVDQPVLVRGAVEQRQGRIQLRCREVMPMQRVRDQYVRSLAIRLNLAHVLPEQMETLQTLCLENKGTRKLYFDLKTDALPKSLRLRSRTMVVDPSPEFMKGITRLFGAENIVLETS